MAYPEVVKERQIVGTFAWRRSCTRHRHPSGCTVESWRCLSMRILQFLAVVVAAVDLVSQLLSVVVEFHDPVRRR